MCLPRDGCAPGGELTIDRWNRREPGGELTIDRWNRRQGSHFFLLTNFPDFSSICFHFSQTFIKYFLWFLFNINFFMYDHHLLLDNCITSLHALKYSFTIPRTKNIYFCLVQKYSHETQIIQHLTYFSPTHDMQWLIHYPKKGNFGIVSVGKIQ